MAHDSQMEQEERVLGSHPAAAVTAHTRSLTVLELTLPLQGSPPFACTYSWPHQILPLPKVLIFCSSWTLLYLF